MSTAPRSGKRRQRQASTPNRSGPQRPGRKDVTLVLTCEHAGNQVPARFRDLFHKHGPLLDSHRGYDPGALELARILSRRFQVPLLAHRVTRLLVETNRSPGHPRLFSEVTSALHSEVKAEILERWYRPHRSAVKEVLQNALGVRPNQDESGLKGSRDRSSRPLVVHIGVHTFTPELDGEIRRADAGILYDPSRPAERMICAAWQQAWRAAAPGMVIRRNYPYRGAADGLITHLRRVFPTPRYVGIELEVNQRHFGAETWPALCKACGHSLEQVLRDV